MNDITQRGPTAAYPSNMSMSPSRIVAFLAFSCALVAAWLAARPYPGITVDAQLYVLQTLATLRPDPLAGDLFLRFGSQNSYTAFPHLAAPVMNAMGVEGAAAAIALATAALLVVAGGWLARTLTEDRGLAWLSVALLVSVPGWYGAGHVLRFDEMYYSARLPAEVLAIAALALRLSGRPWLALPAVIAAIALHPLMGAPALAVLLLLSFDDALQDVRGRSWVTGLAVIGTICLLICAALLAPIRDAQYVEWREMLETRSSFLFLEKWRVADWLDNATPLATLLVVAGFRQWKEASRLAYYALVLAVIGLVLAAMPSIDGRFDLLMHAQTWRWAWLARYIALVMLPILLAGLWKSGQQGRAAALLLGCGWVIHAFHGGALAVLAAAVWYARDRFSEPEGATLLLGAKLMAAAVAGIVAFSAVQAWPLPLDSGMGPRWAQRIVNIAGMPGPLVVILAAAWWWLIERPTRAAIWLGAGAIAIALSGVVSFTIASSSDPKYSETYRAAFAQWRRMIPEQAEVLWHEEPVAVWTLLERRSFMSGSQLAGVLYSRDAVPEAERRAQALTALAPPGWWRNAASLKDDEPRDFTMDILRAVCAEPTLDFVVDKHALGPQVARAEWPTPGLYVYLYDCTELRGQDPDE